jgi:hypothetical protein
MKYPRFILSLPSIAPGFVVCPPEIRVVFNATLSQFRAQGMHPMPPMMPAAQGKPQNGNYKTRICLNWHKTGQCQYAARCNFAHGHNDLRPMDKVSKYSFLRLILLCFVLS